MKSGALPDPDDKTWQHNGWNSQDIGENKNWVPGIMLLDTCLEKNMVWKDTCFQMFTEGPFTVVKTWKPPKYPLTGEWIKKMWDIYTMEDCCRSCLVTKSCSTLCNLMDSSPPGSSVQARILEWAAISFFKEIFPTQGLNPPLLHWQAASLLLKHQGSPQWNITQPLKRIK